MALLTTIAKKLFRTPINDANTNSLIGVIGRAKSEQAVAATLANSLMNGGVVTHPGKVNKFYLFNATAVGSGESMVFDLKKNGTSILSGTFTLNSTNTFVGVLDLSYLLTAVSVAPGDYITCTRTYTAGGTPTPMTVTGLVCEWGS